MMLFPRAMLLVAVQVSADEILTTGLVGGPCEPGVTRCPTSTECVSVDGTMPTCEHKTLFPITGVDVVAMVLVFISTALAAGGGIGGGGLLVPIYLLVCNFHTAQATALSLATISGGSLANLWTYTQRYHPNPARVRPLIDYDAVLFFTPALLAGTTIGTLFSVLFPEWLTAVCLVVVLGYSARRTARTGLKKWKQSNVPNEAQEGVGKTLSWHEESDLPTVLATSSKSCSVVGSEEEGAAKVANGAVSLEAGAAVAEEAGVVEPQQAGQAPELAALYADDARLVPLWKWGGTGALWLVVLLAALLRGGKGGASLIGAQCGGALYWVLFLGNCAVLFVATAAIRAGMLRRAEKFAALGHVRLDGDLEWDRRSTIRYPAVCIFAGVIAGLLGLGGGMVIGPLLVALGCLAQPVAATSAFVVFITATSGLAQVVVFGFLPLGYAAVFGVIGLISTFVGQSVVDYLVNKYKKDAIVILVIAVIMAVALVLMSISSIFKIVSGAPFGFSTLCD